ncbi:tyrosine-type recombinase/integrase, partial [Mesorhizobium sp. B264B1A]|nr:tyrosine-type recombinase/integrase [Mesorhizobium sp. B264B1A]
MLLLAAQTGLRVSEIIDLHQDSVMLGHGAHVRCVGKGRKERSTPLTKVAQQALRGWLNEPRKRGTTALFPNMHGGRLSADGVQALLNKYVAKAREHCVPLRSKRVS